MCIESAIAPQKRSPELDLDLSEPLEIDKTFQFEGGHFENPLL
ncbi:hypothetical protein [Baaleninema simplex]|nr:hypothetical protein [Baaleninema simplex]